MNVFPVSAKRRNNNIVRSVFHTFCMLSSGQTASSFVGTGQEITDNYLWSSSFRLKVAGSLLSLMNLEAYLRARIGKSFSPATLTLAHNKIVKMS